jgi:protein gp37
MGQKTAIAWTHHTFNPWWGCEKVSPGCTHCYAETFSKRTGHGVWGKEAPRRFFGDKHWNEPLHWDEHARRAGERRRVFCASMADVLEDRRDLDAQRDRLWGLIQRTGYLDWLLLTKRPENVARLVPWSQQTWPGHVWLGVTVEDQQRADERMPALAASPAYVRFLSCEPLLGPVDLERPRCEDEARRGDACIDHIDWVIAGGESGPRSRPCDVAWIRSLRDQCRDSRTAFFCKQLGARPTSRGLDNRAGDHAPDLGCVRSAKGDAPDEWPADLRVQEVPAP